MTQQEFKKQIDVLEPSHIIEQVNQFIDRLYNNVDLIYLKDFKVKIQSNRIAVLWESNKYCYVFIGISGLDEKSIWFGLHKGFKFGEDNTEENYYLDLLQDEDWGTVNRYLDTYSKFNNLDIKTVDEQVIEILAEEYIEDYIHYNEDVLEGFKAGAKFILELYNKTK
jgi:hypothetical protein